MNADMWILLAIFVLLVVVRGLSTWLDHKQRVADLRRRWGVDDG